MQLNLRGTSWYFNLRKKSKKFFAIILEGEGRALKNARQLGKSLFEICKSEKEKKAKEGERKARGGRAR